MTQNAFSGIGPNGALHVDAELHVLVIFRLGRGKSRCRSDNAFLPSSRLNNRAAIISKFSTAEPRDQRHRRRHRSGHENVSLHHCPILYGHVSNGLRISIGERNWDDYVRDGATATAASSRWRKRHTNIFMWSVIRDPVEEQMILRRKMHRRCECDFCAEESIFKGKGFGGTSSWEAIGARNLGWKFDTRKVV